MKRLLSGFLAITFISLTTMSFTSTSYAKISGNFEYKIKNSQAIVTYYYNPENSVFPANLIIPDKLGGYPVTSIGDNAFQQKERIITVRIPNSVKRIGKNTFLSCKNLENVTISKNVELIGEDAFFNCGKLKTINVSHENKKYSSYYGVLFNKNKSTVLLYPNGRKGSYKIPDFCHKIGKKAFCLASLSDIDLYFVESIGISAFESCKGLESITIPESVKSISDSAFMSSSMTEIFFEGNAPKLGSHVFGYVGNGMDVPYQMRTNIYYYKGKKGFASPWHGYKTNMVRTVGYYDGNIGFKYTVSDFKATVVRTVDDVIPERAGGLKVTGIANNAISNNYSDSFSLNLMIPKYVTKIETGAFSKARLKNIFVVADNPTFSSVNGAIFNKNQTKLISYPQLKYGNIYIQNSVKEISPKAFENCDYIDTISLSEGLTSIGYEAFINCTGLKRVIIPQSVTFIGRDAFKNCESLVNVSFLGNAPKMDKNIFSSQNRNFSVSYVKGKAGFTNTWPVIKINSYPVISTFIMPYWSLTVFFAAVLAVLIIFLIYLPLWIRRNKPFIEEKILNWENEYDISLWKSLSNENINKAATASAFMSPLATIRHIMTLNSV